MTPFIKSIESEQRFIVSGHSKRHSQTISKLLRDRGGFLFEKVSGSVTHIICSRTAVDQNPDIQFFRKMTGPRPHVVDFEWVLEALIAADAPDEAPYLVVDSTGTNQSRSRKLREQSILYETLMEPDDSF